MVQVAIKLLGQQYVPGMSLSTDNMEKAMTTLRDTYAEFGMGVSTGLDLPGESEGYIPKNYNVANVLTEAFGQYDSYTTIQLAQYVASIANGGKRVAPHIVGGIYDAGENGSLGTLSSTVDTRVLNKLSLDSEQLGIINKGFMTWLTQVLVLQPVKPWQVLLFQLVVKQGQPKPMQQMVQEI